MVWEKKLEKNLAQQYKVTETNILARLKNPAPCWKS